MEFIPNQTRSAKEQFLKQGPGSLAMDKEEVNDDVDHGFRGLSGSISIAAFLVNLSGTIFHPYLQYDMFIGVNQQAVGETSCPIVFGEVKLGVMRRRKEEEGAAEEERSSTNSSSGEIFSGSRLILLKLCQELPQLPELLQKITQWRNP